MPRSQRTKNEEPDLQLAEELVFAGKGLQLEKFDRAETLAGKAPDVRVLRARVLKACCEVKSPRDDCASTPRLAKLCAKFRAMPACRLERHS
jgi:hypothetical protein